MSLGVDLVDVCSSCGHEDRVEITNGITYNLMPMFREAGWDHNELDDWSSEQMLPLAKRVLETLKREPERFRALNPSNGWGSYEDALWFFGELIQACKDNPKYKIAFSR